MYSSWQAAFWSGRIPRRIREYHRRERDFQFSLSSPHPNPTSHPLLSQSGELQSNTEAWPAFGWRVFFLEAGVALCLGFGMPKHMDNTPTFWVVLSNQGLLSLSHQAANEQRTGSRGIQRGQPTPADPRATPHRTAPRSACSAGEGGGDVRSSGICLLKPPSRVTEPCFPGDGWTPACNGKRWMNPLFCFALLAWLWFTCETICISPHDFSYRHPSHSLLYPTVGVGEGGWASSCAVLGCQLELNHNKATLLITMILSQIPSF